MLTPVTVKPVLRPEVEFRVLDDLSGVAVDPAAGAAYAYNPVAAAIIERCDGTLTPAEIVAELVEIFDAPRDRISSDVDAFMCELEDAGLILR